ncbi:hypothetical protein STEG23_030564 [Scotinomys teguina]
MGLIKEAGSDKATRNEENIYLEYKLKTKIQEKHQARKKALQMTMREEDLRALKKQEGEDETLVKLLLGCCCRRVSVPKTDESSEQQCDTARMLSCDTARMLSCDTARMLSCGTARMLSCGTARMLSCDTARKLSCLGLFFAKQISPFL